MGILQKLYIDFSELKQYDLVENAFNRMLGQYADSPILRQLLEVFTEEVKELYDAIVANMENKTIAKAIGKAVDDLGQIVGEGRGYYSYTNDEFFTYDTVGLGWDNGLFYCQNAPIGSTIVADDDVYKLNIWRKILRNHTKFASVPEIKEIIANYMDEDIGFEVTNPFTGIIYVPSDISLRNLNMLFHTESDERVDDRYEFPYPTTASFEGFVYYVPSRAFFYDSVTNGWDNGQWAVKGSIGSVN